MTTHFFSSTSATTCSTTSRTATPSTIPSRSPRPHRSPHRPCRASPPSRRPRSARRHIQRTTPAHIVTMTIATSATMPPSTFTPTPTTFTSAQFKTPPAPPAKTVAVHLVVLVHAVLLLHANGKTRLDLRSRSRHRPCTCHLETQTASTTLHYSSTSPREDATHPDIHPIDLLTYSCTRSLRSSRNSGRLYGTGTSAGH